MMKKRKGKGMIFCIICMMLCVGLCLPASADLGTEDFEQTVTVLQCVGVLEAGEIGNTEDAISRAEFTDLALRAMGINASMLNAEGSGFVDVPDTHPYAGVVKQARELGVVEGNGYTLFYPDDDITYQEAAKILVAVAGYHWRLSNNPLPSFMAMANQLGIMNGTGTLDYSMAARRDVLYKMLENTLDAEVLKQTGYGTEETFESRRGQTVMSEYLKVGKYKGTVTATSSTSYNGASNLMDGQIEIDSTAYTYSSSRSQADALLGYQVTYYVNISDPTEEYPTILLLVENMSDNRVVAVNAEDIRPNTTTKTLYYYTYTDSGTARSQSAQIPETADVIYNGVYYCKAYMLEDSDLQPMTGSVTLLDTDGNGSYDLVKIEDILTIVVGAINSDELTISDYYKRTTLKLDTSEELYITKHDIEINFSDLQEWNVLAIKEDKGKTRAEITVISSKISGTITAVSDKTITVEDQELELAESLKTFLETNTEPKYQISLNDSGSFYLDADGKIAAANVGGKTGSNGNYAYLVKYGMSSGISTTCEMRVLVESSTILTLKTAAKLTIDGISGQNGTDLYQRFSELENVRPAGLYTGTDTNIAAAYTKQNYVIVYKTNEAGEVTEVDTVVNNEEENGRGLEITYPAANKRYKVVGKFSGRTPVNNFIWNNDTIMFNIPADAENERLYTASNAFTHDLFFDVAAYDCVDGVVSVVCNFQQSSLTGDGTEISTNVDTTNSIGIIQKITQSTTEDNESVPRIYMVYEGSNVSYNVVPDTTLPDLQYGDVVVFHTDSLGRIDALNILFQPREDTEPFLSGAASSCELAYGMVYQKFATVGTLLTDLSVADNPKTSDLEPYLLPGFPRIYLVDMAEEETRLATGDDMISYEMDPENASMVFVKLYYDISREAVIYKWK